MHGCFDAAVGFFSTYHLTIYIRVTICSRLLLKHTSKFEAKIKKNLHGFFARCRFRLCCPLHKLPLCAKSSEIRVLCLLVATTYFSNFKNKQWFSEFRSFLLVVHIHSPVYNSFNVIISVCAVCATQKMAMARYTHTIRHKYKCEIRMHSNKIIYGKISILNRLILSAKDLQRVQTNKPLSERANEWKSQRNRLKAREDNSRVQISTMCVWPTTKRWTKNNGFGFVCVCVCFYFESHISLQ